MQNIVVLDLLVRMEMEPALSALLLRAAIPGDRQCLQPAVRKFDEILLQRLDAEGVFHLERGEPAIGSIGLDEEFPILTEETGMHAVIIKARVGEIAKHRSVGRVLHGEFVLRAVPELRLRRMALRAGLVTDEICNRSAPRAASLPAAMREEEPEADCEDDEQCERGPDPDCAP